MRARVRIHVRQQNRNMHAIVTLSGAIDDDDAHDDVDEVRLHIYIIIFELLCHPVLTYCYARQE